MVQQVIKSEKHDSVKVTYPSLPKIAPVNVKLSQRSGITYGACYEANNQSHLQLIKKRIVNVLNCMSLCVLP